MTKINLALRQSLNLAFLFYFLFLRLFLEIFFVTVYYFLRVSDVFC